MHSTIVIRVKPYMQEDANAKKQTARRSIASAFKQVIPAQFNAHAASAKTNISNRLDKNNDKE